MLYATLACSLGMTCFDVASAGKRGLCFHKIATSDMVQHMIKISDVSPIEQFGKDVRCSCE